MISSRLPTLSRFRSAFALSSAIASAGLLFSSPARADDFAGMPTEDETFEQSQRISDNELDKMRGGRFVINNVVLDFHYLARMVVINPVHDIYHVEQREFSSVNGQITASANAADPLIVQNSLNGTTVDIVRDINIRAHGALNNAALAQMGRNIDFARVMATR